MSDKNAGLPSSRPSPASNDIYQKRRSNLMRGMCLLFLVQRNSLFGVHARITNDDHRRAKGKGGRGLNTTSPPSCGPRPTPSPEWNEDTAVVTYSPKGCRSSDRTSPRGVPNNSGETQTAPSPVGVPTVSPSPHILGGGANTPSSPPSATRNVSPDSASSPAGGINQPVLPSPLWNGNSPASPSPAASPTASPGSSPGPGGSSSSFVPVSLPASSPSTGNAQGITSQPATSGGSVLAPSPSSPSSGNGNTPGSLSRPISSGGSVTASPVASSPSSGNGSAQGALSEPPASDGSIPAMPEFNKTSDNEEYLLPESAGTSDFPCAFILSFTTKLYLPCV
jgi:hypothetical protein